MPYLTRVDNNFHSSLRSSFTHELAQHPLMRFKELKKKGLESGNRNKAMLETLNEVFADDFQLVPFNLDSFKPEF